MKHCVVPTLPHKAIAIEAIYSTVLLVIGLLYVMVRCIQRGLREVISQFRDIQKAKNKDENITFKTPNLQIELPYTHLMAWYVLHCPELMTPPLRLNDRSSPHVQCFESNT